MAAASAQPIALPSAAGSSNDYPMGSGSLSGQNGSFNPASYRRFMGSPMSFRAGSFGSRFYPGVSPGQLFGPLDPNDFRFGKMSSSIESDRGSLVNNALNVFERQDELCRDYQCCGVNLTDMHALVDHFEECHVVVVDPYAPAAPAPYHTQPAAHAPAGVSYFSDVPAAAAAAYHQGSFDPDDMELDLESASAPSSGSSSPPDTPVSTPLSAYPAPPSAFDTTTVHAALGFRAPPRAQLPGDAFNAYAGYADYSSMLPGAEDAAAGGAGAYVYGARSGCVPPALLLNSTTTSPADTPGSSRVASPVSGPGGGYALSPAQPSSQPQSQSQSQCQSQSQPSQSQAAAQAPRISTTLSRPATSLLLSKPFKCPKANCNKSYKQANGLKYHMTHGSCNFAPPKDLEQIQALLATKRSQKEAELSDADVREVEREAERRLRPYACGVGECQRRYKNMNGLRYHYQHSGDHGAVGLALLASGQHECLVHARSRQHTPAGSARATPAPVSAAVPAPGSASASVPAPGYANGNGNGNAYQPQQQQQQQQQQQMYGGHSPAHQPSPLQQQHSPIQHSPIQHQHQQHSPIQHQQQHSPIQHQQQVHSPIQHQQQTMMQQQQQQQQQQQTIQQQQQQQTAMQMQYMMPMQAR